MADFQDILDDVSRRTTGASGFPRVDPATQASRDREAYDLIARTYLASPQEIAALPASIAQTERAIQGAPDPTQRNLLQRELMGMRRALELAGTGKAPASAAPSPATPLSGDFADIIEALKTPQAASAKPAVISGLFDLVLGPLKAAGRAYRDESAGWLRGAGSIGSTIMWPYDKATDLILGDRGPNVTGLVTGKQPLSRNEERRQAITDFTRDVLGANTASIPYNVGKIGGEVAGTAGMGNLLALPLRAAGVAPSVATALESGGFATGAPAASGFVPRAADMALRTGAGALVGGASSGLIDPSTAGTGAIVGGALPGAAALAGRAGNAVQQAFNGPVQAPDVVSAINSARNAGYVIPPTQANPSLPNRILEGISGKITTAQNASARNQAVTNNLVKRELGLPSDVPITPESLDAVRAKAGEAYAAISNLGEFNALGSNLPKSVKVDVPERLVDRLSGITLKPKNATVDAAEVVRAWKQANADANAYYRAYGRDANPETLAKAKSAADAAKSIDEFLEKQLTAAGQDEMLQALKNARVLIAKTYSAEKAMNPTTGNIDARKFAADLKKGKVLSGGLLDAANFAGRFPKAAQNVEQMGSLPQISPLDWGLGVLGATQNPMLAATTLARPAMRAVALSAPVQNRLVAAPANPNTIANVNSFLANPVIRNALYSSAANP
jgi:hypothetical protein